MQDPTNPESMKEFGAAFLTSLQAAAAQSTAEPPSVVRALREHFGTELRMLPIVTEAFDAHDHPNVHLAIEGFLTGDGRSAELLGIRAISSGWRSRSPSSSPAARRDCRWRWPTVPFNTRTWP